MAQLVEQARLDMKARGFWTPGVTAFFDVRITHVNSRSNQGKHTATIFKEQENEKKRKYNQSHRCRDGNSYTIGVWYKRTGGMGLDSQNFLRTLANKFSSKNKELYAGVISWRRANARKSAFQSLYGGQFTLSTLLINQIFVYHSPTDAAPQFL